MTVKSHTKMFKQLNAKPDKKKKYVKHNKPIVRSFGKYTKKCERCLSSHGLISKYGIKMCRQCFRENAHELGFKKYS